MGRDGENEDAKGTWGLHCCATKWEERQRGTTIADISVGRSKGKGHFYLEKEWTEI